MDEAAQSAAKPFLGKVGRSLPLFVFAVSLLLRLWGIGWGLPQEDRHWSYHPDEPVLYAYSQQVEPAKLDFEPGFYNYGTLYLTLLRIAGDAAKTYSGAGEGEWEQMRAAHTAGRWISALAGAGAVAVVFLMLRRRLGEAGSLFGAGLVAVAPGFVIHSRFQTVDVLATFFLALSAHFALKLLPDRGGVQLEGRAVWQTALLSGLFAGLSAGTKYTGILALATLIVALALARRREAVKLSAIGMGTALAAFFIVTPGVFLNAARFLDDFKYEIQHTSTGHGLVFAGLPSGFVWHLYNLVVGVGPILLALGIIGLAAAAWKRDHGAIALAAFFLIYYVLIGRAEVLFLRYTFPLLIGLAFGFGWLLDRCWGLAGWPKAVPALAILGLGGIFGGGLAASAVSSVWMAGVDPRDEVVRYLRLPNVSAKGVGIVSDAWFYTPPFYPEVAAPRWIPFSKRAEWMAKSENPRVWQFVPQGMEDRRFDWNTDLLDLFPDFVVFSSFETEGLDRLRAAGGGTAEERLRVSRFVAFMERLKKEYDLVGTFGGTGWRIHDLEYVRPLYWVWKLKGK